MKYESEDILPTNICSTQKRTFCKYYTVMVTYYLHEPTSKPHIIECISIIVVRYGMTQFVFTNLIYSITIRIHLQNVFIVTFMPQNNVICRNVQMSIL